MTRQFRTRDVLESDITSRLGTGVWTAREEEVLRLRIVQHKTLGEVGSLYNVTRERIRQIEAVALHTVGILRPNSESAGVKGGK